MFLRDRRERRGEITSILFVSFRPEWGGRVGRGAAQGGGGDDGGGSGGGRDAGASARRSGSARAQTRARASAGEPGGEPGGGGSSGFHLRIPPVFPQAFSFEPHPARSSGKSVAPGRTRRLPGTREPPGLPPSPPSPPATRRGGPKGGASLPPSRPRPPRPGPGPRPPRGSELEEPVERYIGAS